MAVTHDDLSPTRRSNNIASKLGVGLVIFSILCGLCCFILCLVAEAMRSEAIWTVENGDRGGEEGNECVYSSSGRTPLVCALGAFVALAVAMVAKHAYILVAVSKPSDPPAFPAWFPDSASNILTWQACFFFAAAWVCFAVGEVLLMIGIGVESGHLSQWTKPRLSCLVIRPGLFAAAGVFGLMTVFLTAGLYLTGLHAQKVRQVQDTVRREVLDASFLYAASPPHRVPRNALDIPRVAVDQDHHTRQGPSTPPMDKSRGSNSVQLRTALSQC